MEKQYLDQKSINIPLTVDYNSQENNYYATVIQMKNYGKIILRPENFSYYKESIFPISNESLHPLCRYIKNLNGVKFYIGICGGGTQNLYILSLLSRKNNLKSIKLLDNNKNQFLNLLHIINAWEDSNNNLGYITHLTKRSEFKYLQMSGLKNSLAKLFVPLLIDEDYAFVKTNLERPKLKNMKINLVLSDFTEYIKTSKLGRGRYFIYISNIYTYWHWKSIPAYFRLIYNIVKNINKGWGNIRFYGDLEYLSTRVINATAQKEILPGSIILVNMGGFKLLNRNKRLGIFEKTSKGIKLIRLFPGYKIKPFWGDSMFPAILFDSCIKIIPIKNCTYNDVKRGEIVCYRSVGYNRDGEQRFWHRANVIHRVVGKTKKYALIKGDNRRYKEKVPYNKIDGRVIILPNKKTRVYDYSILRTNR